MIAFHAHVHFKIDHETSKSMINTFANIVWSNSSIYNCELQYVLFTAVNNKAATYKLALFHAATFSIDSSGNVILTYTGGTAWQRVSSIICAQCWNEQAICMWKFKFYGCKNLIFYNTMGVVHRPLFKLYSHYCQDQIMIHVLTKLWCWFLNWCMNTGQLNCDQL